MNQIEQPPSLQPNQPRRWLTRTGYFVLEIFQTVLLAFVLYLLIDSVVERVRVENISMLPTLKPGEFLMVNKLAYRLGDIRHGDVVVFHFPMSPDEDFIKRVIGVAGDRVTVQDGIVFVNEQPLSEDYLSAPPDYSGEWTVPEGTIFVLGDNRNQSYDSHSWGFVPEENVLGRALLIYWPLQEIRVLNEPLTVQAAH